MECLRHVPYASWRMAAYRQLFPPVSVSNRLPSSPRRTISSTTLRSQEQHEQQTPTEAEQPNNEKSETQASRPSDALPRSPLLTNPHVAPVTKHKKRRAKANDLDALRYNPWLRALASPIRMCSITGTRTPRDLLITWGLVQRPDSEGLWFLPVELLKDEVTGLEAPDGQKPKSVLVPKDEGSTREMARAQPRSRTLRHLSMRLTNSIQLLRMLTKELKSHEIGKFSALRQAIPHRFKHPLGPLTSRDTRSLVWRQDMPEYALGRMRVDVMKQLKEASVRKRGGVWKAVEIQEGMSEDALRSGLEGMDTFERMECGAVLVMKESKGKPLPQLMTLPQTGSRVPVFDLTRLLLKSELEEVRKLHSRFQEAALFFRPNDPVALDAMLALWRLKGFLNEDINFS